MKNEYLQYLKSCTKEELINKLYSPRTKVQKLKFKSKRTIAISITYNGRYYSGLASYKYGNSIGNYIDNAIRMSGLSDKVVYAGRTDAGVSAISMVASLEVLSRLESPNNDYVLSEADYEEFSYDIILNNYLPTNIRVTGWAPVPKDFSARFTCVQRQYKYFFDKSELNIESMKDMAEKIKNMTNFYDLSKHSDPNAKYERTIDECKIVVDKDISYLDIRARSFLHNMVRKIFWVLKKCGKGEVVDFKNVGVADPYNLVFCKAVYPYKLNFIYNKSNKEIFKKQYFESLVYKKINEMIYKSFYH